MSHSSGDERILGEIERGLARDDPALVLLLKSLNKQLPPASHAPSSAPAAHRNPRVVVAVVLIIIALLGLLLTLVLGSTSAPPAETDGGPAALPPLAAVSVTYAGQTLP